MKKILGLTVLCLLVASITFAASNEVYSVNVVGFQKKELPSNSGYVLTGMNFEAGETNTLLSVFGTDTLTQHANYLSCDRVVLYDQATQTYQAWAQYTDGVFYKANNDTEWNASISGNPEIPIGTGFFITSASGAGARTIVYAGDVVESTSMPVALGAGYQIVAYPFSSDIALQDTSLDDDGAAAHANYLSADRVHVYENGTYQAYALYTDGVWYKANNDTEWNASIAATNMIEAGQAVFYEGQGSVTWAETNKYLPALDQ